MFFVPPQEMTSASGPARMGSITGLRGTVLLVSLGSESLNVGMAAPHVALSTPSRKWEIYPQKNLLLLHGGRGVLSLFDRNPSLCPALKSNRCQGMLKNSGFYTFIR